MKRFSGPRWGFMVGKNKTESSVPRHGRRGKRMAKRVMRARKFGYPTRQSATAFADRRAGR